MAVVVLVAVVVLILIAAAASAGKKTTGTVNAAPVTVASPITESPITARPLTTVDPSAAQAEAMATWYASYGQPTVADLTSEASSISTAAFATDLPGLISACGSLQRTTQLALSQPAPPKAEVAGHWSAAMTSYLAAARDCVRGAENIDASSLTRASTEVQEGTAQVQLATKAISAP